MEVGGSRSRDVQNLACGSGVGGSGSRDVQNLAYGSGVGGSRSRDVQNLAYGSGVGGSRKEFWNHAHFKQPLFMHPSSQYAGGGRERTLLVLTCGHHGWGLLVFLLLVWCVE